MTLFRDVLDEAAAGFADVESAADADGSRRWSRGGYAFAVLDADGTAAAFWLDPAVATAAAKTPDVTLSGRGPGWVRFSPTVLDDHGIDRAAAWLASAYRRVAGA